MDFEELMKKLMETEGFGETAVNAVKDRISKPNNEAKNLRIRLKQAEESLKKENPVLKILKNNGLEIDEDSNIEDEVNSFLTSLKENNKNSENFDLSKAPIVIKQQKQIDKLLKKDAENEEKLKKSNEKIVKKEIETTLQKHFVDSIANGKKVLSLLIKSSDNPFVLENGKVGLKLDDGDIIHGEKEIMEQYKSLHPDEVLNQSKSGTDTKSNVLKDIPSKFTSKDQLDALSQEQMNKVMADPKQKAQLMSILSEI